MYEERRQTKRDHQREIREHIKRAKEYARPFVVAAVERAERAGMEQTRDELREVLAALIRAELANRQGR